MTDLEKIQQLEAKNQELQIQLNRRNSEMFKLRNEVARLKEALPKPPKEEKPKINITEMMRRKKAEQSRQN